MNIDERLAALAQSVELLVTMHKDNEERMQRQFMRSEREFARFHHVMQAAIEAYFEDEERTGEGEGEGQ